MNIKVTKFGGSSLADAEHFIKVANIIKADPARRYVVPSAPGKRSSTDTKVTDMLYACYESAVRGEDISELFSRIVDRYNGIISDLGLDLDLSREYDRIKASMIHNAGRDYAASRGEYLNGIILAKYLNYDFIDAAKVVFFDEYSRFDGERTNEVLSHELKRHERAVIPGFYGIMPNGTVKTFSRGGSDITGSIVARACMADLYENWTDVSGFLMADPRIVDGPKPIQTITYRELRELSYMGATVLHEDAIFPVRVAGIPINIRNTNAPEDEGTMIVSATDSYDTERVITGIAGKQGFSVISLEKDMMNSERGFIRRALEALEKYNIPVEHMPTGIDTMNLLIPTQSIGENRDALMNTLCRNLDPDSISIEDDVALIAIVGRAMIKAKGTAARIFSAIANTGVNIRMIDQGSSELNIIIGVEAKDFPRAMDAIYREFVK